MARRQLRVRDCATSESAIIDLSGELAPVPRKYMVVRGKGTNILLDYDHVDEEGVVRDVLRLCTL